MGITREAFSRTPQAESSAKKDLAPYTITIPVADPRVINMLVSRWHDKDVPKYDDKGFTSMSEQRLYSYGSLYAQIEGKADSSPIITICAQSKKELEEKFHLLIHLLDSYTQEIKQEELGNVEHIAVSSTWTQKMIDSSPYPLQRRFPRIINVYRGSKRN